ncbi:DUF333 domain-containing protein [Comamonas humi]
MNFRTFLIAMATLPLAACAVQPAAPAQPLSPKVGMANPASVYCQQLGGRSVTVKEAAGERGVCHLPDGTVIDEWELFRRDHAQDGKR